MFDTVAPCQDDVLLAGMLGYFWNAGETFDFVIVIASLAALTSGKFPNLNMARVFRQTSPPPATRVRLKRACCTVQTQALPGISRLESGGHPLSAALVSYAAYQECYTYPRLSHSIEGVFRRLCCADTSEPLGGTSGEGRR